jgi:hypothetical protein
MGSVYRDYVSLEVLSAGLGSIDSMDADFDLGRRVP